LLHHHTIPWYQNRSKNASKYYENIIKLPLAMQNSLSSLDSILPAMKKPHNGTAKQQPRQNSLKMRKYCLSFIFVRDIYNCNFLLRILFTRCCQTRGVCVENFRSKTREKIN
jgi:hypothetical protein